MVEDEYDESIMIQLTSTSCSTRSDLDLSHEGFFQHPHVLDRWCDGGRHPHADEDSDLNHLMQLPSQDVLPISGDSDFAIPNTAWDDFCEVCFLSPEDGSWTLMTYGLLDSHIGTRSVEIDDMTPTSVKAALRAAWDDVPHSARIYAVRPNPDDGPYAHIIIEFEATYPHDEVEVPVLRRIFEAAMPTWKQLIIMLLGMLLISFTKLDSPQSAHHGPTRNVDCTSTTYSYVTAYRSH